MPKSNKKPNYGGVIVDIALDADTVSKLDKAITYTDSNKNIINLGVTNANTPVTVNNVASAIEAAKNIADTNTPYNTITNLKGYRYGCLKLCHQS